MTVGRLRNSLRDICGAEIEVYICLLIEGRIYLERFRRVNAPGFANPTKDNPSPKFWTSPGLSKLQPQSLRKHWAAEVGSPPPTCLTLKAPVSGGLL